MKKLLLILVVTMFIGFPLIAKPNVDSILYTQQMQQIMQLDMKVDSLLKVTTKFNDDKSYFASALSSQTAIFSIIITIALFLFGFVSYFRFSLLINRYKKETNAIIDRQNQLIDSITESNKNHDKLIFNALGNLSALMCKVYDNRKVMVFKFSIKAAKYHHLSGYLVGSTSILRDAKRIIDDPDFFETQFEVIFKNDVEETNIRDLKTLVNSNDENIMTIALHILNKYIEFKRQYLDRIQNDI